MKWFEKRRQKREDYWNNLDLDRELKIQKIKTEKSKQDSNYSRGLLFTFLAFMIPLILLSVISLFTSLSTHFYNKEHYDQLVNKHEVVYPEIVSAAVHDESLSTSFEDLDPNTIVNFNQLFKITNTGSQSYGGLTLTKSDYQATLNGTATVTDWLSLAVSLTPNHKYYYHNNFDFSSNNIRLRIEGTSINFVDDQDFIFDYANSTTYFGLYFYSGRTYTNLLVKPYLIDLTLMFGSNDNIPTLDQCRDLFVSQYYNYTLGTPISLSGLSAYSSGYSEALSSSEVIYSGQLLQSNVYSNIGNISTSGVNGIYVFDGNTNNVGGLSMGFKIPSSLNAGDQIVIKCDSIHIGRSISADSQYSSFAPIYVGYYENGAFVSLGVFDENTMTYSNSYSYEGNYFRVYNNAHLTISSPQGLNVLYFNSSVNTNIYYTLELDITSSSIGVALQDNYNRGYSAAQSYYENLLSQYEVGHTQYNAIKNLGYNEGLLAQNPYTFGSLLSSVIEAPLNAVLNIFNFEFMGVNLKNVVTVLFTVAVLVAILGLFLGGKS